ncbi:Transcriptional regulatory protein OmpR [Enhygromyxa salina]|uniref:Transcriptional regulatory protein OmpR n=1 Tax=Enhygromyxa salina TaxID=215803 RepID=A0A2S9Y8E1_9BACT|nr:response regulator [Enhygromyxa salina]PRQ01322.1 Transcriptional regulatory protein OmpR [Enhygromyxa salina]
MSRTKNVALVVEDDPTLLDLITETIESLGHEVRSASSQEDALSLVEDTMFDYVLLDLKIPLREGRLPRLEIGFTLLERIVSLPDARRPGVIVMTAHGDDHEYCRRALRDGADDFIKKPFDSGKESPETAIKKLLSRRSEERYEAVELPGLAAGEGRGRPASRELSVDQGPPAIHLVGTYDRRRCNLEVNGKELLLSEQRFRLFARLAVHAKRSPGQHLSLLDVPEIQSGTRQALNRLRKDLEAQVPGFWDRWIRNDGHGSYCLQIPGDSITYDADSMAAHPELLTILRT